MSNVSMIDGHIDESKGMSKRDIIKSLECCIIDDCDSCPHYPIRNCQNRLKLNALDLINRREAENEKNENIIRLADKTIETQKAEIEKLNQKLSIVNNMSAEELKDYAERLMASQCYDFRIE